MGVQNILAGHLVMNILAGHLVSRGAVGRAGLRAAGDFNCDCWKCDSTDPHGVLC